MKAVMPVVLPDVMAWRRETGADQWDEMWDGVLHMPPMPTVTQQLLEGELLCYLTMRWARPQYANVVCQINLAATSDWKNDYRIPDILLMTRERLNLINRNEYFEGAPNAVIEIHSPGDEAYDKLDFYEALAVPEVWIIDRDTKDVDLFVLKRGRYKLVKPNAGGWIRSPSIGVELRAEESGRLGIRMKGDDATYERLPHH